MRMSAATCKEVLYEPLPFPDPHAGLKASFPLRASSARKSVVGISDHDTEFSEAIRNRLADTNQSSMRQLALRVSTSMRSSQHYFLNWPRRD